jgi:hypothetical protein
MSERYNGWTNYATWRINLEMIDSEGYFDVLDDWSPTSKPTDLKYDLAQVIKENCADIIREHGSDLALDYALAFLDEVEWREIARHIYDDWIRERE